MEFFVSMMKHFAKSPYLFTQKLLSQIFDRNLEPDLGGTLTEFETWFYFFTGSLS